MVARWKILKMAVKNCREGCLNLLVVDYGQQCSLTRGRPIRYTCPWVFSFLVKGFLTSNEIMPL